ncbi:hypothetical protein [Halobellus captivus]|uniref:hypothetical protein n=1 Tax=Halobellus captivus TaxID=2592614 RepID=UPI0011A664CA|nr:hypothetical protein [Halobellus captivus]
MTFRRDLLMGVGAILSLAGCAEPQESDSTTTTTQTQTETTTQTTDEPTESATSKATETETETEVSTPDPRVTALDSIEQKIVAELTDFSINAEIDTRSLGATVQDAGNNDRLYEARSERGDIDTDDLTSDQQERYSRLESAYWFVWWLELLHNDAAVIIDAVPNSWDNERGSSGTGLPVDPLRETLSTASGRLEDLKEDSSKEGLAELEGYGIEDYDAVVSRYEQVIDQGELLIEQIRLHQEANGIWQKEEYEKAEEKYRSNAESYAGMDWLNEYQSTIDEMICYAETMVERSQAFYRAQSLEEAGETESAEVERELAPNPEEECSFGDEEQTETPQDQILNPFRSR